jgi:hypothetical protein
MFCLFAYKEIVNFDLLPGGSGKGCKNFSDLSLFVGI